MSHLVQCRGGGWWIGRSADGQFWVRPEVNGLGMFASFGIYWNGITEMALADWSRPSWLPIAWACCQADTEGGPKFAAAILDAAGEEDVAVLVAADWLEERGAWGLLDCNDGPIRLPADMLKEAPGDWNQHRWAASWIVGPLASWCRHLITSRCADCGGRRDGEDAFKISGAHEALLRPTIPAIKRNAIASWLNSQSDHSRSPCGEPEHPRGPAVCPRCGFAAHPKPPFLPIPEVVKVAMDP